MFQTVQKTAEFPHVTLIGRILGVHVMPVQVLPIRTVQQMVEVSQAQHIDNVCGVAELEDVSGVRGWLLCQH